MHCAAARQGEQSQHAHEAALEQPEERAECDISYKAITRRLYHKVREYTGFYSVQALDAWLELMDGGEGLFESVVPAEAGEEAQLVAELITTRHENLNVGDYVAPVLVAPVTRSTRTSMEGALHNIPVGETVQVHTVSVDGANIDVMRVSKENEVVMGVTASAFTAADAPVGGGAATREQRPNTAPWTGAQRFASCCSSRGWAWISGTQTRSGACCTPQRAGTT